MKPIKKILCTILVLCLLLSLVSCASEWEKEGKKVIGTCGDYEVLYEELRFVTLQYKDVLAAKYGEQIWDTPESAEKYRAELEETVWNVMLNNYTVLFACNAYRLTKKDLESDAIQDAVDEQIDEVIDEVGGKEAFETFLRKRYLTENFMRFSLAVTEMEYELYYVLTDDLGDAVMRDKDAFYDWLVEGNYSYVQHIFIRNDAGDDIDENRALAEQVRQNLIASGDATKMIGKYIGNATYNEDAENTAPYYVVKDVSEEVLEDAALSLTITGQVSPVVEAENGFYVLVRMKETTEDLMLRLSDLHYSYQWAKVEETVQSFRDSVKIELNDFGKSIDLLKIEK